MKLRLLGISVFFLSRLALPSQAGVAMDSLPDRSVSSTRQQAFAFLDSIREMKGSIHWPSIEPARFYGNLKAMIQDPISIYPGNGTNFCGYGALTYLLLLDNPLGFARLLWQLYQEGTARIAAIRFTPSASIQKAAGQLRYKGKLDIRPAEQMWYLCLADRFKGYLNIFNRRYDPGDEDKLWAAVNYAKFNRMLRKLMPYKVNAWGGDIFRPRTDDPAGYILEKMKSGPVVLYINNRMMRKKNHTTLKLGVPTHYIVLEKLMMAEDLVTLVYWDYGGKTLLQLSPHFLKRILFGITWFTPPPIP